MCDEKIFENGKKIYDYNSKDAVLRESVLDCLSMEIDDDMTIEKYISIVSKRIKNLPAVKK